MLAACQKHGNIELGKLAFDHAVHLQIHQGDGAYVLTSNVYTNAGLQVLKMSCTASNASLL